MPSQLESRCRRPRAAGRLGALLAVVALADRGAVAGDRIPAAICRIARDPLAHADGPEAQLACANDEDGNRVDDEVETQLAGCFVPQLRFDSAENARRPDEPHVLFSAYPISAHRIRIRYAVLFARDGGYVLGTRFPCSLDDHDGDSEW